MCDSPNLYFAIAPSGIMKVCCDFEIENDYYVYNDDFVERFNNKKIHEDVYKVTNGCIGCMYGSYPEVTITARYMSAFIERARYFNIKTPKLKKYSKAQLQDIANDILNEQA